VGKCAVVHQMSRAGSTASSGRQSQVGDLFEDEGRITGVLQSLIDQNKLQKQWQKVGSRLKAAEGSLSKAEERLDKLPQEYVPLPKYKELVEKQHAQLLKEHSEGLAGQKELTSRISETVFTTQKEQIEDLTQRVKTLEEHQSRMQQEADTSSKDFQEFRDSVNGRLSAADKEFREHVEGSATERREMKAQYEDYNQALWTEVRGLEVSLQDYTRGEIQKALKDALNFDRGGVGEINTKLLQMVERELVDAVKIEHKKTFERLIKLGGDLETQRSELIRQIRVAEQKAADANATINAHKKEISADLEKRPYVRDVRELEQSVRKELNSLSHICEGLQTRTVLKLNEFVDHVGKLHETIDDHEHCLRHHAEEIENRSTKYDLLLCQSQIDKCVATEDWTSELQDLKKVINWQTNKIENFGLSMGPVQKTRQPRRRLARDRQRHSVVSQSSTMDFQSENLMETSLDEGTENPDDAAGRRTSSTSSRNAKRGEGQSPDSDVDKEVANAIKGAATKADDTRTDQGSTDQDPTPDEDTLVDPATAAPSVAASHEEEDDLEDEETNMPGGSTNTLLRQQVEAVAMGLVGLAHLTLADAKLGMSSQERKYQRSDLLEQLQDLRHWITHKTAPSGWDPGKLTTIALRYAHSSAGFAERNAPKRRRSTKKADLAKANEEEASADDLKKRETISKALRPQRGTGTEEHVYTGQFGKTGRRPRTTMLQPLNKAINADDADFVITGGGQSGDSDKPLNRMVRRSVIQEGGAERNADGDPAKTAEGPASARARLGRGPASRTIKDNLPPLSGPITNAALPGTVGPAPATVR